MKRYGNFFDDNDIWMPSSVNYLGEVISRINSDSNINQVCNVLRERSEVLYKETNEHQEIQGLNVGNGICFSILVFKYNSNVYYWWDMYKDEVIVKSALEFKSRSGHAFMTHVWFATDTNQSPFIWTIKNQLENRFK